MGRWLAITYIVQRKSRFYVVAYDGIDTLGADPLTVARFLTEQWLPVRRHDLDPSTAHRYSWIIDHYITPAIGHLRLRSLRTEHLDRPYTALLATGGARRQGLPPRPCTTSTSSAAPPSTTPSTPTSSPPTPPTAPERPSHGAANA